MKNVIRLVVGLVVFTFAPPVHATDRFVAVRFDALEFEGDAPDRVDPVERGFIGAPNAIASEAYVVLDGGGEAYLDFEEHFQWDHGPHHPTRLVARVGDAVEISGRVFMVKPDSSGFEARRFELAAPSDDPGAKDAYFAVMEAHYHRLLDQGLPGAAWFRHRVAVARAARGLTASETAAEAAARGAWRGQPAGFDETFDLFTGGRALAENLDLDRALRGLKDEEASFDIARIAGVTTRPMDWKALIKGLEPELDPLAKSIPADQHAVFFPSFAAMVSVFDEVDSAGTPVLQFGTARAEDQRTKERYQEQLCLPLSAFARLLGPAIVSSVAITGSDPLLPSGTDVALLFECKAPDVLAKYIMLRHAEAKAGGAIAVQGSLEDVEYGGVRSEDRRICSYLAQLDGVVVVTNSLVQLERIAAARSWRVAPLTSAEEYVWFRDRYEKGDASESALMVLTDAAIRRWAGPRARIGDSRRVRAAAAMAELQARHLDALVAGSIAVGSSAADPDLPFSADFVWSKGGIHSPTWGSLAFSTPVAELSVEGATQSEKQAYDTFRQGFESRWRNVFDPIALRLTVGDHQDLAADLTVMPLVVSSEYDDLRDLTRDATLAPSAGDAHDGTLFHFASAFGKRSGLARMFSEAAGPFALSLGADPLGWIGSGIALYADRDAFWNELLEARDRDYTSDNFYRLPLGLHVEVKDPLKLAAFLTALRAMVDGVVPGMTLWQNKVWNEQGYIRIGVDGDADFSDAVSEAALYYAAMQDSLVLSLREDVVQRAIDRRIARKAGQVEAAREKPWIGSSVGLRAEGDAADVFTRLASDGLGDRLETAAWSVLPILNEWKRRFPSEDPVALHQRLWGVRLTTPAGGTFAWNEAMQTMEASDYGSPATPRSGPRLPGSLERFTRAEFGLSFEGEGLRARVELERRGM